MTPISVMTTPMIAVRIGRPAATNAPKVTSRMTNATIMPMISGSSDELELPAGIDAAGVLDLQPACVAGFTAA